MAVLDEIKVFSVSSKSWKTVGLSTGLAPRGELSRAFNGIVVVCWRGVNTYC